MIDTHAHLQGLDGGADAAVEQASAAGLERIVCVGADVGAAREAIALAERHAGVFATVGLHPHSAEQWSDEVAAELAALATHPHVVAIGECGLDYFRDHASRAAQARAFAGQVALAERTGKALVVHSREAADDTLTVLREARCRVVLHCFSLPDHLDEAVERGWWCSFAGNVTYPKAPDLQEAVRRVPDELLLLETDCPYLTPVPHRGTPNRPERVLDTLAFVAELRGCAAAELATIVERNADRVFGL